MLEEGKWTEGLKQVISQLTGCGLWWICRVVFCCKYLVAFVVDQKHTILVKRASVCPLKRTASGQSWWETEMFEHEVWIKLTVLWTHEALSVHLWVICNPLCSIVFFSKTIWLVVTGMCSTEMGTFLLQYVSLMIRFCWFCLVYVYLNEVRCGDSHSFECCLYQHVAAQQAMTDEQFYSTF